MSDHSINKNEKSNVSSLAQQPQHTSLSTDISKGDYDLTTGSTKETSSSVDEKPGKAKSTFNIFDNIRSSGEGVDIQVYFSVIFLSE